MQNMPPTPDKGCCVRCNAPRESTIHDAFSKNTEIRMAAHQFVPAVVPAPAAPPSVDGLEAQCALIEELRYQIREAWPAPWSVEMFPLSEKAVAGFAAFIRTRDRELVEKLEGLAEKWEKENSLRSDDSYRYPQQLRAVLAALLAQQREGK